MKLKFVAFLSVAVAFLLCSITYAESLQFEVDLNFTFGPTLSIDLTDDSLTIDDLVPGNFAMSDDMGISIRSNSTFGYQLIATVGNPTYNTRNLVHSSNNVAFSSLDVNTSVSAIEDDSTWGYSIDDGNAFSGLPAYNDMENVSVLVNTSGASESYLDFAIGAKAAQNQAPGSYRNVINFIAVANPEPAFYMQDVSQDIFDELGENEVVTLRDSRTGLDYDVTAVNLSGVKTLWMNTNLRLPAGTSLTPSNSNVSSYFSLSNESWTSYSQNYHCKQMMTEVDGEYYYNWYAAMANPYDQGNETAYGCSEEVDAYSLGDICPKNWHIPTKDDAWFLSSNSVVLDTLGTAGLSSSGEVYNQDSIFIWTSTRVSDTGVWSFWVNANSARTTNISRDNGSSVRCLYSGPADSGYDGTMQSVDSIYYNGAEIGDVVTMVDARADNKTYEISVIDMDGTKAFWMNSNLKLPAGTVLTPSDSNVTSDFTLSTESWTSGAQNYYCKQIMKVVNGNYYYNWYAATANPYECENPTSADNADANDSKSLGSICPKGWRLIQRSDTYKLMDNETVKNTFSTTGFVWYGYLTDADSWLGFWTNSSYSRWNGYILKWDGSEMDNDPFNRWCGVPVRCIFAP